MAKCWEDIPSLGPLLVQSSVIKWRSDTRDISMSVKNWPGRNKEWIKDMAAVTTRLSCEVQMVAWMVANWASIRINFVTNEMQQILIYVSIESAIISIG